MAEFVDAHSKATGEKVRVPAHFFDVPSLSKGLSSTPRQKKADERKRPKPARPVEAVSEPVAFSSSASVESSTIDPPASGDQDKE